LISGRLTRVVILGMWLPFNLTVPFLPPVEMLGHLPIFGIMYLLLVYGSGSPSRHARLPTEEEREDSSDTLTPALSQRQMETQGSRQSLLRIRREEPLSYPPQADGSDRARLSWSRS
jgi:hypothetical protein